MLKDIYIEDFLLFVIYFCTRFDFSFCFVAAKYGQRDVVALLLDNNANINQKNFYGYSALMVAGK